MNTRAFRLSGSLSLLAVACMAGEAKALCVPSVPSVTYAQTVPVRFVEAPDVLLHTARSQAIEFDCDRGEDANLRPVMAGLTYVRDIDYAPAYEVSPYSPLMTITFESELGSGSEPIEGALDAFGPNPWYLYDDKNRIWVALRFYSRGGPMRPQPQRSLGEVVVEGTPSTAQFRFEIGYDFQGTTCTLSNAHVVLDPISATHLDAAQAGGDKDFTVTMNCGVPGRPVSLQIFDAIDRGNTSDVLAPAGGSDAQGVGLQILHKGAPLPMGRVWAHTDSTGVTENIPFSARYLRLPGEAMAAGAITGEAVLLADYY